MCSNNAPSQMRPSLNFRLGLQSSQVSTSNRSNADARNDQVSTYVRGAGVVRQPALMANH
jgi:hypothetical protein